MDFQAILVSENPEIRLEIENRRLTSSIQLGTPKFVLGPLLFCGKEISEIDGSIKRWCGVAAVTGLKKLTLDKLTPSDWTPTGHKSREAMEKTLLDQTFPGLEPTSEFQSRLTLANSSVTIISWDFIRSYDYTAFGNMPEDRRFYHPDSFLKTARCNPPAFAGNIGMEEEIVLLMEVWARTISLPSGLPNTTALIP